MQGLNNLSKVRAGTWVSIHTKFQSELHYAMVLTYNVKTHIHSHVYTIYTYMHMHLYIHTYPHIYIYTYKHMCTDIHMHTQIHTYVERVHKEHILYQKKKILLKYKSYEERNMLYTFKLPNFAYSISLLSLNVTNSSLLSSQLLLQLLLSCSKICFLHSHNTWCFLC